MEKHVNKEQLTGGETELFADKSTREYLYIIVLCAATRKSQLIFIAKR